MPSRLPRSGVPSRFALTGEAALASRVRESATRAEHFTHGGHGIVGHSAIEMTTNVYGHVNLDVQRAALAHFNDELQG